jgi:hypothetical protein
MRYHHQQHQIGPGKEELRQDQEGKLQEMLPSSVSSVVGMTPQTFMLCCWGYGKIVMWCGGFRGGEVCVVDEIWKKKKERKKKKQEFNLGWFGGLI